MRKHFLIPTIILLISLFANAQTGKNIRIGYIDTEYILENVPEYNEANIQLEQKAQKWKQEMEAKKNNITKLKESLKTEQVLLTKELIQERQDEITFLENELIEFQQKKFGPAGELVTQKTVLVKPIQDQIFTAVQDLAEAKKYDFIFDKSSDLTMLFAAKRYDVSDYVIRSLARSAKRNQMSKKQIKEEEAKEYKENLEDVNPDFAARQKLLEERKAAREKLIEERKSANEAKKQEADAKKKQMLDNRNGNKTDSAPAMNSTPTNSAPTNPAPATNEKAPVDKSTSVKEESSTDRKAPEVNKNETKTSTSQPSTDIKETAKETAKKAAADAQKKAYEDRKKEIEQKKAKVLQEREAAKKAKQEQEQINKNKN